jgi:2-polyprenyl-6-methoxyphenol hydroxylase-like FAD-dependent oxidoreductase
LSAYTLAVARGTALIVGAGIGGLAAGLALRRAGWAVRVFERAPQLRATGFALSIAPNAVQALDALGLGDRVRAIAWPVGEAELRDGMGRRLKRFSVEAAVGRSRSLFAPRQALLQALHDALGPDRVHLNSEATALAVHGGQVSLTLRSGEQAVGELLIGADGGGSIVRKLLHPDEAPPRRSDYIGVRGLSLTAAPILEGNSIVGYMGGGVEAATIRVGQEAVYWYVSARMARAPRLEAPAADLLAWSASRLDSSFRRTVESTRPEDVRIDALFDREVIEPWGRGPVTLLGDASGPVLPHTGQGAALALEDAVALGLALDGRPVERALRFYERVRAEKKRPLVTRGRRIARFTTASGQPWEWLRGSAIRLMPAGAAAAAFLQSRRADPHRMLRTARSE